MSENRTSAGDFSFKRTHRLSGIQAFDAVFNHAVGTVRGPLRFFVKSNGLSHPRLGLSVSRRVGSAPCRNKIKRQLREAFRLLQHDIGRVDWVVAVRRHEPLGMASYQKLMDEAWQKLKGREEATRMGLEGN